MALDGEGAGRRLLPLLQLWLTQCRALLIQGEWDLNPGSLTAEACSESTVWFCLCSGTGPGDEWWHIRTYGHKAYGHDCILPRAEACCFPQVCPGSLVQFDNSTWMNYPERAEAEDSFFSWDGHGKVQMYLLRPAVCSHWVLAGRVGYPLTPPAWPRTSFVALWKLPGVSESWLSAL